MNKDEINKKIGSSIFNFLITIDDSGKEKALNSERKFIDIPNFLESIDSCHNIIDHFKKKGYFVSITYIVKDNKIFWNTKISKNRSIYDSGLCETICESICKATLAFIDKKNQKKQTQEIIPENILSIDFKK